MLKKLKKLFSEDIWNDEFNKLPKSKYFGFASLRVVYILIKGFFKDKCTLHASALTFTTLMSMVPMLAVTFSTAKGFGAYEKIREIVNTSTTTLPSWLDVDMINRFLNLIDNVNLTSLGIIGSLLIFGTVISVMGKIESTFNAIWGVTSNRTLPRKFADYISVLLCVPILLIATSSLSVVLHSEAVTHNLMKYFGDSLYHIYLYILNFFNVFTISFAFSFLYIFMPNTKVKIPSALLSGFITAILWIFTQWIFITFQVGVTNQNKIYGSFASIPLFLGWLYSSWLIILFGSELCFAFQNYRTYEDESDFEKISPLTLKNLGFLLITEIAEDFHKGKKWKLDSFVQKHHIPFRLINRALQILSETEIITPVDLKNGMYVPGKDLSTLTLYDVKTAFDGEKNSFFNKIDSIHLKNINHLTNHFENKYNASLKDIPISDILKKNAQNN